MKLIIDNIRKLILKIQKDNRIVCWMNEINIKHDTRIIRIIRQIHICLI